MEIKDNEAHLDEEHMTPPEKGNEFLGEDEKQIIKDESTEVQRIQPGQGPISDRKVIERSYTERQYVGDVLTPIGEPSEPRQVISTEKPSTPAPNPKDVEKKIAQDRNYAITNQGQKDIPKTGGNPSTTTMTNKERQQNLENTVNTALEWYEKGWEWLGSWITISDSKLIKRENAGKTPADWAVLSDTSTKEFLTLREFVHEGNALIKKACKTDPEFLAKVKPMLMQEFDRRNWIISPQESSMFMFGSDILNKGQKLLAIWMQMKRIMDQVDKEFAEKKKNGSLYSPRDLYNMQKFIPQPEPQPQPQPAQQNAQQTQQPQQNTKPPHTEQNPNTASATPNSTNITVQTDLDRKPVPDKITELIKEDNEKAVAEGKVPEVKEETIVLPIEEVKPEPVKPELDEFEKPID